jgi:hypothetical protein
VHCLPETRAWKWHYLTETVTPSPTGVQMIARSEPQRPSNVAIVLVFFGIALLAMS